jgi:pimeloyl-ACP methyl ester carboxylesterase
MDGARDACVMSPLAAVPVSPLPWTRRSVQADGFPITVREAGAGDPVVLLHGAGGPQELPAHDAIARHARVIALQLPGFGDSPANERTQTFEELARTVLAALDALGLERCSLLGTSFGGATAAWVAALEPQRVDALILEAPAALAPGGGIATGLAPDQLARALRAHPERGEHAPPPPDVLARQMTLARRVLTGSDPGALRTALAGLDVPTMVVFGTRDGLIAPESGRDYKRLIPRCTLVYVYDAAHEVAADRPEAFADLVVDFLARRDAHVVSTVSREINR